MKNITTLIILILSQIAFAQRPTGNVFSDESPKRDIKIQIKEKELITKLNDHVRKCYPEFEKQKSLPDLIINYRVLISGNVKYKDCSQEQMNCLTDIPQEIRRVGETLLGNSNFQEHLRKKHNLEERELQNLISDLKKWLRIKSNNFQKSSIT
jgi:hypothetical protein